MDQPVALHLHGVQDFLLRVFHQEEPDSSVESGAHAQIVIRAGMEVKGSLKILKHGLASAPGSSGRTDEIRPVQQGNRVMIGKDRELGTGGEPKPFGEFVRMAELGVVGVVAIEKDDAGNLGRDSLDGVQIAE